MLCGDKRPSKLRSEAMYARKNRECAEIILAETPRYGSEESLMVRWCRLVGARGGNPERGMSHEPKRLGTASGPLPRPVTPKLSGRKAGFEVVNSGRQSCENPRFGLGFETAGNAGVG